MPGLERTTPTYRWIPGRRPAGKVATRGLGTQDQKFPGLAGDRQGREKVAGVIGAYGMLIPVSMLLPQKIAGSHKMKDLLFIRRFSDITDIIIGAQ